MSIRSCTCPGTSKTKTGFGAEGRYVTIGNCDYTVTALTIERNRDVESGDIVDLTYEVPEHKALASIPEMDSPIDVLPGVTLSKAVVTPGVAGITSVKLTYSKPLADEEEEEEEDGSSEGSAGEDSDSEEKVSNFHSSLDVTVVDEPLLLHPKMSVFSGAELEYLKAYMDGARAWELVPVVEDNGKPKLDKDGMPIKRALGKLINMNSTAAKLIRKGITTYKDITATYNTTYTTRAKNVDTSKVGKIDSPPKAPPFPGKNWMLIARMVTLNDDGKTYTVESSWLLSGHGGWNTNLYGS